MSGGMVWFRESVWRSGEGLQQSEPAESLPLDNLKQDSDTVSRDDLTLPRSTLLINAQYSRHAQIMRGPYVKHAEERRRKKKVFHT